MKKYKVLVEDESGITHKRYCNTFMKAKKTFDSLLTNHGMIYKRIDNRWFSVGTDKSEKIQYHNNFPIL